MGECFHPIEAYQSGPGVSPTLWPELGLANLLLPCGGCLGCLSARATQWGLRADHEASMWSCTTFLTLTYDDDKIPEEGHLAPRDLCLFLKRLRKRANPPKLRGGKRTNVIRSRGSITRDQAGSIRYFACGEYGDRTGRPHYHALLFNCGFTDLSPIGEDKYTSEIVSELWPHGLHQLGVATPGKAATYIAKYHLKQSGRGDHDADGVWRPAPFMRVSTRPAIGYEWLKRYKADLTYGYLVDHKGYKQPVPRTYLLKLKDTDPQLYEEINIRKLDRHRAPYEAKRMEAAEIIQTQRMTMRNL